MGRLLLSITCIALLLPVPGFAAPPPRPPAADLPPPPPPPPPAAAVDCFPACRTGFFCYQGACRSACNPPCNSGEQCLENGQCTRSSGSSSSDDAPVAAPRGGRSEGGVTVSEDGERAPPGFHYEMQRKKGLLITGPVLFGVGWIFSIIYGVLGYSYAGISFTSTTNNFAYNNRNTYLLYVIPVAGPVLSQFLFATSYGYSAVNRPLEFIYAGVVTALQITGLVLGLLGLKSSQVAVQDRYSTSSSKPPPVRWTIAPGAPGSALGVTLLVEN